MHSIPTFFHDFPRLISNSQTLEGSVVDSSDPYRTHEHTLANLSFATTLASGTAQLHSKVTVVAERQKCYNSQAALPSSFALELETNPSLRCHTESVRCAVMPEGQVAQTEITEVFAALRRWKDSF